MLLVLIKLVSAVDIWGLTTAESAIYEWNTDTYNRSIKIADEMSGYNSSIGQVLVGGFNYTAGISVSCYIETNLSDEAVALSQVSTGVEAISYIVETNLLARIEDCDSEDSRKAASEPIDVNSIHVVLKFGFGTMTKAISDRVIGATTRTTTKWLDDIILGENASGDCMGRSELLENGTSWANAWGAVNLETCSKKRTFCKTNANKRALVDATRWADIAIKNSPYSENYRIGISDGGNWNYCVKLVPKEKCLNYADCIRRAENIGCPGNFCTGSFIPFQLHDEL